MIDLLGNEFVIKINNGYFTGFEDNKVTYILDNQPYAYAIAMHYDTKEEAKKDADVFGGQVVNVRDLEL